MRRVWAAVGIGAGVLVMLGVRLHRYPMEAYGDSAAQYIEHLARLRMLERIRVGVDGGPLDWLVALDGLYPPGLHLVELGWGTVWGHGAASVAALGLVWWLALCLAVAVVGHRIAHRTNIQGAGPVCFAAMALLPATQGAALRSYYDLPMTVCLWSAVAVLLGTSRWRGLGAGLLLVGATLIKWTALPFGGLMVLGWAAWAGRPAWRQGTVALGVVGLWTLAFLWAGAGSLETMGSTTFQPPFGTEVPGFLAWIPGAPGHWAGAVWAQLSVTDLDRVMFYPWRLVTTVLAPLGAVWVVLAGAHWIRQGAVGARLVGIIVVGQWLFLLLFVPPLDDRFLLTLAPALGLLAGLGLAGRSRWATLAAITMLMVSGDAHLSRPEDPMPRVHPTERDRGLEGRVPVLRAGLSSSTDRRGWSRSSDLQADRGALRDALWAQLLACGGGAVHGPEPLITPGGDLNWWSYRSLLGALDGEPALRWLGEPGADPQDVELWIQPVPSDVFGGSVGVPDGWVERVQVADPGGGPGVALWSAPGSSPCP